jgi:hypothetical protein
MDTLSAGGRHTEGLNISDQRGTACHDRSLALRAVSDYLASTGEPYAVINWA